MNWRVQHEHHRALWNAVIADHERAAGDVAGRLRAGGTTLFPEELAVLGPLPGVRIAHLLCNRGADTLSLAARGARVTGVDISEVAIPAAERLAADTGISARFVRSDVLDWLATTDERFDVVFASYGSFGWIADLDTLAACVRRVLDPGGRLVIVDFHPAVYLFDADLRPRDGAARAPIADHPRAHGSVWGLGDLVGAVLRSGMRITRLTEHDVCNGWKPFHTMIAAPGDRWTLPATGPRFPLMYTLEAERPLPGR